MTEDRADDATPTDRNSKPSAARKGFSPYRRFIRPRLRQIWLNVQAWIPFLINPFERRRLVRVPEYVARDELLWQYELPRQCWKTAARSGLEPCRFEGRYRSFDRPLVVFGAMFLALLVVSTLSCVLGPWLTPTLYLTIIVLALIVLWMKSWRERVQITIWSLPEHVQQLEFPDMAIYNDYLLIYLPTVELARAAQAELRERRHEFSSARLDESSDDLP